VLFVEEKRKDKTCQHLFIQTSATKFREPVSRFIDRWDAASWRRFIRNVWKKNLHCKAFLSKRKKHCVCITKEWNYEKTYIPDFVCYGKIIVELKAVSNIAGEHKAQILNYLKASGFELGLLVNFGSHPKATVERFVW